MNKKYSRSSIDITAQKGFRSKKQMNKKYSRSSIYITAQKGFRSKKTNE